MTKHYLFVCSANCDRSPTAQELMREMAEERELDVAVKSAGLHVQDRYGPPSVQLTPGLCDWADEVYVMEQRHVEEVVGEYGQPAEKVKCLGVEDIYGRGSPQLKDLLRPKLSAILEESGADVDRP